MLNFDIFSDKLQLQTMVTEEHGRKPKFSANDDPAENFISNQSVKSFRFYIKYIKS